MTGNTALFAGKEFALTLESGEGVSVKVRQLPLREYDACAKLLNDEFALVAAICGHKREWAMTLSPESYEQLQAACQEVNAKGFFAFTARRAAREAAEMERQLAALSTLNPESLQRLIVVGQRRASTTGSPASASSPG